MTTYTIYASTNDQWIRSSDSTWLTARSGGTLTFDNTSTFVACASYFSSPNYRCDQAFLQFDLSAVPPGKPTTMSLTLAWLQGGSTDSGRIAETTFGGSTADFVPGANLAALTQFATFTFDGAGSPQAVSSTHNPPRSAAYQLVVYSRDQESATATSSTVNRSFSSSNTAGTASDPVITITDPILHKAFFNRAELMAYTRI